MIQLSALGYGMYALYQGRPVWIAYTVDRFELIRANEVIGENQDYPLPWIAPEYIWFRKGVCWNHVTSNDKFAARFLTEDMLFETAAPAIFFNDEDLLFYVTGYLNSHI